MRQTIRRILREELSARVRRRVPYDEMENEFLESFDSAYNLTKRRTHFLDELIYSTVTMMMDGIHWRFVSTLPEDEFWYDDIHKELENHYKDRIIQMYNERQGINESILREETEVPSFVRRRVTSIDWQIKFAIKEVNRQYNVCGLREEDYVETVIEKAITSMYWDFFSDMDDNSKEWEKSYNFMIRYADEKFTGMLKNLYQSICK